MSLPLLPCGRWLDRPTEVLEVDFEDVVHDVVTLVLFGAFCDLGLSLLLLYHLYHMHIRIFIGVRMFANDPHIVGNFLGGEISCQ